MPANITFNPMLTTSAAGSFNVQDDGFIQGCAMDDPSTRFALAGGVLLNSETISMWGGVGIFEDVPGVAGQQNPSLGGNVGRANSLTGNSALTGFSVFDQNYAAINTPQSPVPLLGSLQTVNFYRFGSRARVPVACDPILANLEGGIITQQVSWDFVAQRLIPFSATYPQTTITGAVWASTGGGQVNYTVSTDLTSFLTAGDDINVSGVVSTGATTNGYNGNYHVVSLTSTNVIVSAPRAASPGTYASGGVILAGGGALPVKIIRVNIGNSMTVVYDPVTGFATWNRAGSCALILL